MSAVVGEVRPVEHRGHPVEERGLGDRAGGRQQAVDGPLDPIGEGRLRSRQVVRVGQPPAARLDLGQAPLGRAAELVADQREQALDGVRRGVAIRGATACAGAQAARRRRLRSSGVPSACVAVGSEAGIASSGAAAPVPFRAVVWLVSPLAAAPPLPGRSVAVANRRSCPDRSSPTRISPSSRSKRAGSPRARSVSTAASVTTRAVSAAENGLSSNPSGGANRLRDGTTPGSPAPPGSGSSPTLARVRDPGGSRPAGRDLLDDGRRVVVGVGQACAEQPVARRGPAEGGRHGRLRTAVDEPDDPAIAGERGFDRLEGPRHRGRLDRPRPAQRRAGETVERQKRGRLPAEDPRRRVIGGRQALEVRAHRRLAQDQPDPRRRRGPAVGVRVVAQADEPGRAGQADEGRRRAFAETPQVLARGAPGRDRARRRPGAG